MKKKVLLASLFFILAMLVVNRVLPALTMNGFNLEGVLIPAELIERGGPPRDGIPSIDKPVFTSLEHAAYLKHDDRVLGVSYKGIAKAYPVRIMDWHEIVNDEFSGDTLVVTYCPLCGTGMAFLPEAPSREFGVSGLLYNNDVLLYDRETESLWSQIMGQGVSGPQAGKKLKQTVLSHTSWQDWHQRFPDTIVLSTETGYKRDYSRSPYLDYAASNKVWFSVAASDERYHVKEWVLGVTVNGKHKAYPFSELKRGNGLVVDKLDNVEIHIRFDQEHQTARAHDADGNEVLAVMAYWFAWFAWIAFHPDTQVYVAS